ncbi:NADH-quinone oxidoreductase subunit NuoN [Alkalilimnicola sp. S0819]|uniref:NADH-quinone oxidoreductase subunit NuoN n=1 Tax=Alkalilimnicola sp. S0819 TaxID=2613922 RepID=UPI0012624C6F|nr:NADH-quinone oxidoreductase subunit NuoN [Alkalilimnicola sp. S0819]KAB7628438.1 NADH-quinone oxidoreductase subunit NuoN [Alkalilimnicola sp. S0819]MPQ15342.1 NADH-quinone oxidoreductase subunit NuoN [Alkalilimnicola sp. S0819]
MNFEMPDFGLALPEIWLLCAACVILVVDLFSASRTRAATFYLTQLSLAVAAWLAWNSQWLAEPGMSFSGHYMADRLGVMLKLGIYGLSALAFAYARNYLLVRNLLKGEFFLLGLFGVLGMSIMASAHSLLTLYMGLELLALCQYALVVIDRESRGASEAAMKYFVLGALASGMLLYGMSMIYGVSGSLYLADVAAAAGGADESMLFAFGLVFLVVGVAFKFGAVPFHMWVPDVYQGAPTPVTLYLGTAPKVAAVALFLRLIGDGLGPLMEQWQTMLIILAVLSLAVGNLFALVQDNLKRMLAYSTVSHVGFVLLGLIAGTEEGYAAALFYALTYGITAAGAFGMIVLLSRRGFEAELMSDFKGLARRNGYLGIVLLLLMFSMTGVPGTVGFYAKLLVVKSVVDVNMIWLAVFAVIFAVVGAFYYLRLLKMAFFDEPEDEQAIEASAGQQIVMAGNGFAVLALGIFPGGLMALCLAALGL